MFIFDLLTIHESVNLNILQWNGLNGERLKFIIKESIEKFFTEASKRKLTELLQRTWNQNQMGLYHKKWKIKR